eukprot:CAMPEP_0178973842 /NCGR_PEP_ID=MMETSP0789-20121207/22003_1 /TAXON_ID=3005 /ORGANISM="Rhizosolenia setigera, Strain CCMP 1694" /LENGTH=516 /DNA_ID=CAMNT_0020661865 /DNA_START=55 /DNA_END=1605 /DNA_ORIENTATION=-
MNLDEDLKSLLKDENDRIFDENEWKETLFEQYIGPYEEFLNSTSTLVKLIVSDEIYYEDKDRSYDRWSHLEFGCMTGTTPDIHIYVGLFFGEEAEKESREKGGKERVDAFIEIQNKIAGEWSEVRRMPIKKLARNILTYLQAQAAKLDPEDLFRLCVMYGLSSAAGAVVNGKLFGVNKKKRKKKKGPTLSVNTPLEYAKDNFMRSATFFMPALGYAAIIGHQHVISKLLELGADLQTPYGGQHENAEYVEIKTHRVGAIALKKAILAKQPEMVKFLTSNCGVQFRWLSNQDLETIFKKLFHIECQGDEYGPVWWSNKFNPEEYMGMSDLRRARAKNCYKEKQKMLQEVVNAGIPSDLFLPTIDLSIDEEMTKEAEMKGMKEPDSKMCRKATMKMTRRERKARGFLTMATMQFNCFAKRGDTKSTLEFYQDCLKLWSDKDDSQESVMDKFEEADPRWRLKREEKKGHDAFQPWWETHRDDCEYEEDFADDSSHEMVGIEMNGFYASDDSSDEESSAD